MLRLVRDEPRSVGEIAEQFDITQQAVSQHLQVLKEAGLVGVRKDGQRRLYLVRPEGLATLDALPRRALAGRARAAEARPSRATVTAEPFRHSVHIAAEPEQVFEYFTRPEAIVRWMGDYAVLDPRPDGEFTLDINGVPVRGRYLELEPPRRLLISWGHAGSDTLPPGASTVEITLIARGQRHDRSRRAQRSARARTAPARARLAALPRTAGRRRRRPRPRPRPLELRQLIGRGQFRPRLVSMRLTRESDPTGGSTMTALETARSLLRRLAEQARRLQRRCRWPTDFEFTGPVASFDSAEGYRAMAREAGQAVTSFEVRRQFVEGNTVCSIIDWEMAMPGLGRMTAAELLEVVDGEIVRGELIYDAEALRRVMAQAIT